MRHRKRNIKLGRTASHRDAMLRNMAQSLLEHGQITTTVAKAKAVKPVVDRLVTLAKRGDLHSIRQAGAILYGRKALVKLFQDPHGRFGDRVSGFTLMVRTGPRLGDAAPMCILKLVSPDIKGRGQEAREVRRTDRASRVAASRKSQQPRKGPEVEVDFASAPAPAPARGAPTFRWALYPAGRRTSPPGRLGSPWP